MPLKDFLMMGMNNVDPSPEVQSVMGKIIRTGFEFAGYVLTAGAFLFIAKKTQSIPVWIVSGMLAVLLASYIFSMLAGFVFFDWRRAKTKFGKFGIWLLDAAIFLPTFYVVVASVKAIVEALTQGLSN